MNRRCRISIGRLQVIVWRCQFGLLAKRDPATGFLPANDNPVWNEFYVAIDASSGDKPLARGAYALKQEQSSSAEKARTASRATIIRFPKESSIVRSPALACCSRATLSLDSRCFTRSEWAEWNSDCEDAQSSWLQSDSDSLLFPRRASGEISARDASSPRQSHGAQR